MMHLLEPVRPTTIQLDQIENQEAAEWHRQPGRGGVHPPAHMGFAASKLPAGGGGVAGLTGSNRSVNPIS